MLTDDAGRRWMRATSAPRATEPDLGYRRVLTGEPEPRGLPSDITSDPSTWAVQGVQHIEGLVDRDVRRGGDDHDRLDDGIVAGDDRVQGRSAPQLRAHDCRHDEQGEPERVVAEHSCPGTNPWLAQSRT